jgi:conjugal transfer pilus assembly protein TraK
MPEDVPQRELRLVLDDTWVAPVIRANPDAPQSQMPSSQADFVDFIKSTLRSLAKGDVPDGHALTPLDPEQVPRCQVPGLALRPAQMLEGPTTRIAVYIATNPTDSPLPFQESGCYRKGVLAVSAFPRPFLEAGQSTEVYVVLRKEVMTQTATGKKRPVLVSQ